MSRRVLSGTVVSDKNAKTLIVKVVFEKKHPIYQKRYKRFKKYAAHYEGSDVNLGDFISIMESRPISKTKKWCFHEVVRRAVI